MENIELYLTIIGTTATVVGTIATIIGSKIYTKCKKIDIRNNNNSEVKVIEKNYEGISKEEIFGLLAISENKSIEHVNCVLDTFNKIQTDNFINIVKLASEKTKDEIKKELSPEWSIKFIKKSSEVSDNELQELWAKLLARELVEENSVSLRTLEVLSNLSAEEARLFNKFSKYVIGNLGVPKDIFDEMKIFEYEEIMKLREAGLVSNENSISMYFEFVHDNEMTIHNFHYLLKITRTTFANRYENTIYGLTLVGKEIYKVINSILDDKFFYEYSKWARKKYKDYKFSFHKINNIVDKTVDYDDKDILDEVKI